ncbi:glycoside hydrolase family 15 protein [Streptomyces sp. DSM 40750]|uniref:glycoside hydrolase family 15 protein n=1 Tax=Streptomyces sp. DSM 40750 TaxID=2801030 RepID=UPI00214CE0A0|nr:glycoside hydrolase family 15 protein [Streptomyces sp. DSM 40750]UUU22813.1 glycoside hydrolase family 15 protein [Streptomyces sp. DSM 40750]
MSQWSPVPLEGYLPIEDHGLIGDGRGCALVGRDGAIGFMCVPRFDSPPLFCSLLDRRSGGSFLLAPDGLRHSRQYYVEDSGVLVTELRSDTGVVEVTDAFLLEPGARLEEDAPVGRGELVRWARVTHGTVDLAVSVQPRGGARYEPRTGGWRLTCPRQSLRLHLTASRPLPDHPFTLPLRAGDGFWVRLRWSQRQDPSAERAERTASSCIDDTTGVWRRWSARVVDDTPRPEMVRRSAITLKLLDHVENGAIVAAPTSSLPERIGGDRNWDYRYTWIRDAAYTVFALRRIGLPEEAGGFLHWALTADWRDGRPRVLYDVDGRPPQPEVIDEELEGYRASVPVRWGNAAVEQIQHDVYGEILDCAFQWAAIGRPLSADLWHRLSGLAERSRTAWTTPDHGIWEVRTHGRPFTYSAAMCQVALDRAARLATRLDLPGDATTWAAEARYLTDRIIHDAWDETQNSLTEHLGHRGGLDASLLALPLRRVLSADHPRMVATAQAITERLGAGDGLLFRYLPQDSPDGINEPEGAFLLCSFWLVDNLVGQGRVDEATELFEKLCSYASPLGLFAEQIDPADHSFLGNYPQALSHVGLLSSAVVLSRAQRGVRPELSTHAWFQ